LCNRLHYFENILSQVVTLEIWNSTFKNIGNRLHTHGNRLLLCKTVIKLFWASGNRLLSYGNQLSESKNSDKRFFFEKFFLYLSWCFSWGSCISWVFTWIFLISLILFEWIFNNLWHHQNNLGSFASTLLSKTLETNFIIYLGFLGVLFWIKLEKHVSLASTKHYDIFAFTLYNSVYIKKNNSM